MLVLTGAGGVAFCPGADLKAIETFAPRLDLDDGPLGFTRLTPSKPAIAAIEGLVPGGRPGAGAVVRPADRERGLDRSGFPERRWGVRFDGGTQRLPRVVGLGALDLILTGRMVPVDEAHAMGLVNEVVEKGQALERALQIAEALATLRRRRCWPTDARRSRASACRSPRA